MKYLLWVIMAIALNGCVTYDEPCPKEFAHLGDENGMCTKVEVPMPALGPASQARAALEIVHLMVHDEKKTGHFKNPYLPEELKHDQ